MKHKKLVEKFNPRQTLFWDVDPKTINPDKHARYIIERILDFGKDDEIRWMVHYYPQKKIRQVLQEPRSPLHERTKTLWQLVLQ